MTHLTHDPISVDALLAEVRAPDCGGTCLFLGTVRNATAGKGVGVTAIDYSAYDAMADAELGRIVAEGLSRWPDARIAVRHRLGSVPVGAASIAIAAAAPHRAEAFDACRFVIEEVKQRLPVWKKELRDDGAAVWV